VAEFQSDRVKDDVKKPVKVSSSQNGVPEVCAACGNKFVCGATQAECWCSEVKLSESARAKMKRRYQRCLCRECLERFAAKE
jgi:hypothetical protein